MPVKEIKQIQGLSTADLLERTNKRNDDLETALKLACECIADTTGSCPFDTFNWDNDCCNSCEGDGSGKNETQCYIKYFIEKARTQ